jgi:ABC-type transport system substrate-binding protein
LEVSGLRALDSQTIRIELTHPNPDFLWLLAMPYAAVIPHEAVTYYGRRFGDHPVGSGPYVLKKWRRNHEMVFERKSEWRGWQMITKSAGKHLVPYDKICYRVMDDASTQWLAFLAGEIDFLGEISRDNWDAVIDPGGTLAAALQQKGFALYQMPTLEVAYIGFNMEDPVIGKNKLLRQALNCAFDDARWISFFNNRVIRADGPVPPGVAGKLEEPFKYGFNLTRARELLAQAGYPDGRDPETGRRLVLTLDLGRTTQDIRESTELMKAFFERVGIDLQPCYNSWPAFLEKLSRRESQMFRIGWVGDYPGALNFLQLFVGRLASPGPNRCNYVNPAFDALYDAYTQTGDVTKRLELCRQMQAIVREDCPWLFIHFPRSYSLTGPAVKNYIPSDFPYGMEKYLLTPSTNR